MYTCQRCLKQFSLSYKVSKAYTPKYCSKECRCPIPSSKTTSVYCKVCNKLFSPSYYISAKQKEQLTYCSNSCKSKDLRGKWPSKTSLVLDIKRLIKRCGRYVGTQEIIKELHVSSKTLNRWNISVIKINKDLGFKQPKSYIELLVATHLQENYPHVLISQEHTFKDLIGSKGGLLRYDIGIDTDKGLIELDDPSHWERDHKYFSPKQVEHDRIKDYFAKEAGIPLLRIRFNSVRSDLSSVLDKVDKFMWSLGYSKSNNP